MRRVVVTVMLALAGWAAFAPASPAQNDWQFPDPRFGIVEFGPGRPGPVTEREYREEIGPPGRFSAPGLRHRSGYAGERRVRGVRPLRNRGRARTVN